METFHYRSGELFCEDVPLQVIAGRFGTPAYVYSRTRILDNYRRFSEGLAGLPCLVCYSVKANSNLRILKLLGEAGAGFDIVSGGELARVVRAGARPASVVFSGVGKTADEIDAGLHSGILMFNVESAGELELIEARAAANPRATSAGIAIRINPDVAAETHPYISTGQTIHKFGVPKQEAIDLYRRAAASPHLKVRGVACHIGSQIVAVEPFLQALDEILAVAKQLRTLSLEVEYLDLGGGFGIRYATEAPLDFDRLTAEIKSRLAGTPYRLIVEPGRSLVGDAGALVTRVLYVKQNEAKSFVIADAGMNDLMRPALYGSHHEIVPVQRRQGESVRESTLAGGGLSRDSVRADIVGPLCETGDFLARDREIEPVGPGDLLAVLTAGAYGYVLASNYNTRPRPAEVLVHGGKAELIRRRESVEDLMAGEDLKSEISET